ncbi:MAG: PhoH family protein [Acidobacteria bacterium]|nr:PhoH family protein [Acidobacteriota bacterium]
MKKNFVLDTNVLLHDPYAMYKFQDNNVLIPLVVVEEIDKFKRDQSEVGRNARTCSRFLDNERQKGSLNKGVELDGGGTLKVLIHADPIEIGNVPSKTADNYILGCAVKCVNGTKNQCILVTKDCNLRIKADALGIPAQDYRNDKVEFDELYTGRDELLVTSQKIDELHERGYIDLPEPNLFANEFLVLKSNDNPAHTSVARVSPNGDSIQPISAMHDVWGIKPLNLEQRLAMELLLDPVIKLITLIGKAGTGKTLMALAAGLHQVIDESDYHRLLVSRPVLPLGKDIGYLPGDVDEKLKPWMQPIFDNLEYILSCNASDGKGQPSFQYLFDKGWMSVEPLTYMRGRSIPNQYLIIDEAQNLTPHEIKSVITRAGHGTKIVLTGDPHQIDNPFLDASTNGISYLVNRFRGQRIYGHMTLTKGERSELAELASNLL